MNIKNTIICLSLFTLASCSSDNINLNTPNLDNNQEETSDFKVNANQTKDKYYISNIVNDDTFFKGGRFLIKKKNTLDPSYVGFHKSIENMVKNAIDSNTLSSDDKGKYTAIPLYTKWGIVQIPMWSIFPKLYTNETYLNYKVYVCKKNNPYWLTKIDGLSKCK